MKPHYFVNDVITQLKGFGVTEIHFEIKVGGNGIVGDGNTTLIFDVHIPAKDKHSISDKDLEKMLGTADNE